MNVQAKPYLRAGLEADNLNWREQQHRGIVDALPGLDLLGKDFIISAMSETLPGVCRDAKYLAKQLAATRVPQDETEVRSGLAV